MENNEIEKPDFEAMAIEAYPMNNELQEVYASGLYMGYSSRDEQIQSLEAELKEAREENERLKSRLMPEESFKQPKT